MRPKVIKTETEYEAALARVEELFGAKPGTPEGDDLELWVRLVEIYEEEHFPIGLPDPIAASASAWSKPDRIKDYSQYDGGRSHPPF